jgi:hypothetical protein
MPRALVLEEASGGPLLAEGIIRRMHCGLAGIDKATLVGLTDIAVTVEVDTSADARTIERLIKLTERYCAILQTLAVGPMLTMSSGIRTP